MKRVGREEDRLGNEGKHRGESTEENNMEDTLKRQKRHKKGMNSKHKTEQEDKESRTMTVVAIKSYGEAFLILCPPCLDR